MSGRDLLLEYAFPIQAIQPVSAPSADYLKQVCIVAKPAAGQEGNVGEIYECTTMLEVATRTDNTNAQQLFDAGMVKTYILLANDLDLSVALETASTFFTLLVSDDFVDNDISKKASLTVAQMTFTALEAPGNDISIEFIVGGVGGSETVSVIGSAITVAIENGVSTALDIKTALDAEIESASLIETTYTGDGLDNQNIFAPQNLSGGDEDALKVGDWTGVVGVHSSNISFLTTQALKANRTPFFGNATNKAKNMTYAFGKLLSDRDWKNQQYIIMPFNDDVDTSVEAENLYDAKISFVINSAEYGNKLALFTNYKKAIVAPYIFEWFKLSMQGWGVSYIALNQPKYTLREASLLQDYLQDKTDERFIKSDIVEFASVSISLVEDNFKANGDLVISEPKALWRVDAQVQEGLI